MSTTLQINPGDFNTKSASADLQSANSKGQITASGRTYVTYTVRRLIDLRNLDRKLAYQVTVNQRLCVFPQSFYQPGAGDTPIFENYPALVLNKLKPVVNNKAIVTVKNIFPRTLNSSVNTSTSDDQDDAASNSYQSSSGSSTTNVNSFGVSDGVSAGIVHATVHTNAHANHSTQNTISQSQGQSTGISSSAATSASDGMSIKDWSAYSGFNPEQNSFEWVFAQTYPWDVINLNQYTDPNGNADIQLPIFVQKRMISRNTTDVSSTYEYQALPPSELSMFGLDLSMSSDWIIEYPDALSEDETISFEHKTKILTATHGLAADFDNGDEESQDDDSSLPMIRAYLDQKSDIDGTSYDSGTFTLNSVAQTDPSSLNQSGDPAIALSNYALMPIDERGRANGTTIGFSTADFLLTPKSESDNYKVVSPGNTVQVSGYGFQPGLTTQFKNLTSHSSTKPRLEFVFKISDTNKDYRLVLMHWIGEDSGPIKLWWYVNDSKGSGTAVVVAKKGESAEGNLFAIELRNSDFSDLNFHDYLVIGTNKIGLSYRPEDESRSNEYTVFAATIGV